MQVSKWGNSYAIRLPISVVKALDLREGDDIEVTIKNSKSLQISKTPDNAELLKRLRNFRGTIPKDFKFDRDEDARN